MHFCYKNITSFVWRFQFVSPLYAASVTADSNTANVSATHIYQRCKHECQYLGCIFGGALLSHLGDQSLSVKQKDSRKMDGHIAVSFLAPIIVFLNAAASREVLLL